MSTEKEKKPQRSEHACPTSGWELHDYTCKISSYDENFLCRSYDENFLCRSYNEKAAPAPRQRRRASCTGAGMVYHARTSDSMDNVEATKMPVHMQMEKKLP